ncbi:predicted protein [Aspergillus terreus NIH2624]|uniref:Uncharacterized protein n=1 Tax=Aspergillus terreus (strain NIH 2624 / FGSC A1156) TaxID=341663 RepID=Q0CC17_ASPTN|nr:uncharacterized protein ATEG_08767 [Aspergillus terreus NIH2624]EAU30899.1 predicted protein [Aspergillus terreus NIH2624]
MPLDVAVAPRAASVFVAPACVSPRSRTARRVLLLLTPRNETRAFSVVHETLFWLNSAMMVVGSRSMSNVSEDWVKRRGRSLPTVAFLPLSSVVMQLASPAMVHREPVKPFVQTQEQTSALDTLTPPFSQGVVFSQVLALLAWLFGIATRKTGTRTATRMIARMMKSTRTKSQGGIPQQRRWGLASFSWSAPSSCESRWCRVERRKKTGHEERYPFSGVAAGGGNEARMLRIEPDLRYSWPGQISMRVRYMEGLLWGRHQLLFRERRHRSFSGSKWEEVSVEEVRKESRGAFALLSPPETPFEIAVGVASAVTALEASSRDGAGDSVVDRWIVRSEGFPRFPKLACRTRPVLASWRSFGSESSESTSRYVPRISDSAGPRPPAGGGLLCWMRRILGIHGDFPREWETRRIYASCLGGR